jgi:hypothetical protein
LIINYLIEFYSFAKCAKQDQGTNLCGYFLCENIRLQTEGRIRRRGARERQLQVWQMMSKLSPEQRFVALQEEFAAFLLQHVIDVNGEHYYLPPPQ